MFDIGDTSHLHIEFFMDAIKNEAKSLKEGRPIFEDKEMVRIKFVGDPKKELVAPADDKFTRDRQTGEFITYAQAYHLHYDAFKTGEAVKGEGTPLSELPFLTAARRAELKLLNIHNAEALAGLEGTPLSRLGMYGRELKNQAKAYIEAAKKNAPISALVTENTALKARLEALEAAMNMRGGGGSGASAEPIAVVTATSSPFDAFTDDQLKAFIKEQTGQAPRGNPSHATLLRMATEAVPSAA